MDNLKVLEQKVDTDIDSNGAPGSILATNHNDILHQVLTKVGKYTGSPYLANKVITVFTPGLMSWESNALNNTNNFDIKVAKLTADLNDFAEVLSRISAGNLLRFKDHVGRSVDLEFQSYVADVDGSANDIYVITVKGVAQNINYTYQVAETEPCVFSIAGSSPNVPSNIIADGKVLIFKGAGNVGILGDITDVELNDYVQGFLGGFFIIGVYVNTLADNDRTNIDNYDLLSKGDI